MTEREQLQSDIKTLRDSIRQGWKEMDRLPMTKEERGELRKHINWLVDELKGLLERLDKLDGA